MYRHLFHVAYAGSALSTGNEDKAWIESDLFRRIRAARVLAFPGGCHRAALFLHLAYYERAPHQSASFISVP